jgi:type VI secretion system protein
VEYDSQITGPLRLPAAGRSGEARMMRRLVSALCCCAGLLLLLQAGCRSQTVRLQTSLAIDANNNSPVLFSVVVPHNQVLMKKLMEMTAKQWFAQREQLLRDFRKELDEAYFEFVPGQQVPELTQKVAGGSKQGIIFVNYQSAAPHRYTFDTTQPLKVSFGQRSVTLAP